MTETDIDGLGHVGNIVYLRWVLDVATAHSAAAGWDMVAYERLGAVWVVKRHEIDYLAPAFRGEAITLETWVDEWGVATSLRRTKIFRGETELARAATRWVLVSFPGGRPRRVPAEMRADFERFRPD